MGRKADEFRAQARRLEERAETVFDANVRFDLLSAARLWRRLAREAECYERDATRPATGREPLNRKAAAAALARAVRVYWEHEKARPVPDFLMKLAAAADDACLKALIPEPNARPGAPSPPRLPTEK
jgi:hypothetical protein